MSEPVVPPLCRLIQRRPSMLTLFQKSFSARAVSRSHQRAEHILKNLQQEEEKRRLGREASIITAIPVAQEACYEPTCSPPPEQEEEGRATRHTSINYKEQQMFDGNCH